jgi:peptidoglycan/xylan/chitin deacetylase (PgdA/CDA1 family)
MRNLVAVFIIFLIMQSAPAQSNIQREVAVTVDDLPASHGDLAKMKYVTDNLLRGFRKYNVPAIGFVNEGKLNRAGERSARTALLQAWLDAGLELGNHSFSHVYIDRTPIEEYKKDVIRGETVTKALLERKGLRLRYYRHTQLRTGPTPEYKKELADFLAARGYTVAPVTMDNNENIFAIVYADAKSRGDAAAAGTIAADYVAYMERIFDFFEKLSVETFGREIRQTLLIHANELNADHFDQLAEMMKNRGYTFVSLGEALKDPAYDSPDTTVQKKGLSWLHRWRASKGLPLKWSRTRRRTSRNFIRNKRGKRHEAFSRIAHQGGFRFEI